MTAPGLLRLLILLCIAGCDAAPNAVRPSGPAEGNGEDAAAREPARPKIRRFRFTYGSTITGLPPGRTARVWVPVATDSHEQRVTLRNIEIPSEYRRTREKRFGNELIHFEAAADASGRIALELEYEVERREALLADAEPQAGDAPAESLAGSRLVPVDGTLRRRLFGDEEIAGEPLAVARRIYDAVAARMSYAKPEGLPWGRGDAIWACESGVGNCTDFHSPFLGAAQDLGIPARFEIGFSIPPEIGSGTVAGYHCWARFLADGLWVPVDISEADKRPELRDYYFGNLTADRVRFTIGRDLELDPPQRAGPVNFLVYPYVEVDGEPHTEMTHRFEYADIY
ncbi:MAG: transglutaminase domain-containing protein [Planctomycetales bacterium]